MMTGEKCQGKGEMGNAIMENSYTYFWVDFYNPFYILSCARF